MSAPSVDPPAGSPAGPDDALALVPLQALARELAAATGAPSPGFRTALRRRLLAAARAREIPLPRSYPPPCS